MAPRSRSSRSPEDPPPAEAHSFDELFAELKQQGWPRGAWVWEVRFETGGKQALETVVEAVGTLLETGFGAESPLEFTYEQQGRRYTLVAELRMKLKRADVEGLHQSFVELAESLNVEYVSLTCDSEPDPRNEP
jgi:hypothetical protein